MQNRTRIRLSAEMTFGTLSAVLLAISLKYPNWIERMFDVAPDAGDGTVEWRWVAGFSIATLALFADGANAWWRLRHFSGSTG